MSKRSFVVNLVVWSAVLPAALGVVYALGLAGVSEPARRSPADDGDAGPVLPA